SVLPPRSERLVRPSEGRRSPRIAPFLAKTTYLVFCAALAFRGRPRRAGAFPAAFGGRPGRRRDGGGWRSRDEVPRVQGGRAVPRTSVQRTAREWSSHRDKCCDGSLGGRCEPRWSSAAGTVIGEDQRARAHITEGSSGGQCHRSGITLEPVGLLWGDDGQRNL